MTIPNYTAVIRLEGECWLAECPEVEPIAQGRGTTPEEALAKLQEAAGVERFHSQSFATETDLHRARRLLKERPQVGTPEGKLYRSGESWCDAELLGILKQCSEARSSYKWDQWRKEHSNVEFWLQKAPLAGAHLEDIVLTQAHLEEANLRRANFTNAVLIYAHLEKAELREAEFGGVDGRNTCFQNASLYWLNPEEKQRKPMNLWRAHFDGADLSTANFAHADLHEACLLGIKAQNTCFNHANLCAAYLDNADLRWSSFYEAKLQNTHLNKVKLWGAHLKKAALGGACLQGAIFGGAHLESADFITAIVDSETLFAKCSIDEKTRFTMVGLDSARIESHLLAALKTNIRRITWKKWYQENKRPGPLKQTSPFLWNMWKALPLCLVILLTCMGTLLCRVLPWGPLILAAFIIFCMKCPILRWDLRFLCLLNRYPPSVIFTKAFWWLSDYGSNTKRVLYSFAAVVLSCALFYGGMEYLQEGLIKGIEADKFSFSWWLQMLSFSVSTMTTFGAEGLDTALSRTHPIPLNVALGVRTIQQILGYIFLAVLVTRIGILFQSLGPEQEVERAEG